MAEMANNGKYYASQYRAHKKYDQTHYEYFKMRFKTGEKDAIQNKAKELGYESFNAFIMEAIKEKLEREQ